MRRDTGRTEIVCVGETLWDLRVPEGAQLAATNHVFLELGGSAANVAGHLVKLGVRAGVLGVVGDDLVGHALLDRLAREGIDVRLMQTMQARTGLVMLTNTPPGAVGFRASKEEADALRRGLKESFDATIVHFASILPSRDAIHAMTRAARRSQQEGAFVTLDANLRPRLWRDDAVAKTNPYELLAVADVVKVSADDMRVLGEDDPIVLRDKLATDVILIVTNGPAPVHAYGPWGHVSVEGIALDAPMAIGAGDAFMAGCLSELLGAEQVAWGTRAVLERMLGHGNEIARAVLKNRPRDVVTTKV